MMADDAEILAKHIEDRYYINPTSVIEYHTMVCSETPCEIQVSTQGTSEVGCVFSACLKCRVN